MSRIDEILEYWFGDLKADAPVASDRSKRWFAKDASIDREIEERFGADIDRALEGDLDDWMTTARGTLALLVLLDQFSRNAYRGTPKAFAGDVRAQLICLRGLEEKRDRELAVPERAFFYMPLAHAEDRALQRRSVEEFERLAGEAPAAHREMAASFKEHAARHRDVVDRFGRFPHRNEILGRTTTEEEESFLGEQGP